MESKPVRCIVVPARPPIDKYIAAKRVYLDLGQFFRLRVAFCDVNIPTPEHFAKWDAMCSEGQIAVPIDVGDDKYYKGFMSAAEMQKLASSVEGGSTWNWLVDLANENNRTGNLKHARHSVAKMVREVYHVMHSGDSSQEVVWDHGMDVVESFFWRINKRAWDALFEQAEYAELKRLWDGFDVREEEVLPFTLPMYFRKLFMSGRSEKEIVARISWWINKNSQVQVCHRGATMKQYQVRRFQIQGKPAGLAHIENYFEALAFSKQWLGSGKLAVSVVRNKLGQVHVQSSFQHKGADFSQLYKVLAEREPTRWYHETRFSSGPMLMNGSWEFTGVPATAIADEEVIRLVSEYANLGQSGVKTRARTAERGQPPPRPITASPPVAAESRAAGETICVATQPGDMIVFAKRVGANGLTRFVLNAGQRPSVPAQPEPWEDGADDPARRFWTGHALVWDCCQVDLKTVTTSGDAYWGNKKQQ